MCAADNIIACFHEQVPACLAYFNGTRALRRSARVSTTTTRRPAGKPQKVGLAR